jgi:hypothetical protein
VSGEGPGFTYIDLSGLPGSHLGLGDHSIFQLSSFVYDWSERGVLSSLDQHGVLYLPPQRSRIIIHNLLVPSDLTLPSDSGEVDANRYEEMRSRDGDVRPSTTLSRHSTALIAHHDTTRISTLYKSPSPYRAITHQYPFTPTHHVSFHDSKGQGKAGAKRKHSEQARTLLPIL